MPWRSLPLEHAAGVFCPLSGRIDVSGLASQPQGCTMLSAYLACPAFDADPLSSDAGLLRLDVRVSLIPPCAMVGMFLLTQGGRTGGA
jgi:hypothetical protein